MRQRSPWLFPDIVYYFTPSGIEHNRCLKILHGFTNKVHVANCCNCLLRQIYVRKKYHLTNVAFMAILDVRLKTEPCFLLFLFCFALILFVVVVFLRNRETILTG